MILVCATVVIGLGLNACGVKSSPQYPSGSSFPMVYPPMGDPSSYNDLREDKIAPSKSRFNQPTGIYQYPNSPSYKPPDN